MELRKAQLGFWFLCLLLLPLPFISVQIGLVPVVRMLLLGSLGAAVWVVDADYISALVAAMLVQGLLWGVLLFFVTRALSRRLSRTLVAAVAAALLLASVFPIYRTPFSTTGVTSSIFEIFN